MSTNSNKELGRRHLLKGAAALGAFAALGVPGMLDAAETEAAGSSLVGVWLLTDKGAGSMDLVAFTKDGLMIDAGSVQFKSPKPVPASDRTSITIGLGSWAPATGGGYAITFTSLVADVNQALEGMLTISAHAALSADGDTFHAPYTATMRAGGKVLFTGPGSVTGTRIKPAM